MRRKLGIALGTAGLVAVLAAARRAAYAPPDLGVAARAEAAFRSGPWTHGYKMANSMKLHYAEMGNRSAPLVLLLHGFPECWYQWRYVMPGLAERFHVVAPDMRGYNWSERPRGVSSYTLGKLAADVAALVPALGHQRAHVVGHDWGGVVAWRLAAAHPDRVDKLAVLNAPHPGPFRRELLLGRQLLRSYYAFFFQLPLLPEAAMRLLLRFSLRSTAYVPGTFPDEALDVYEHVISQAGAATAMINYYRAAGRDSFRFGNADLTIDLPTMVIWGMRDFALVPALLDGLDRWVPDLRVQRVADSGHWVPEEKPALVTESLLNFLSW